jgi:hypothetical protein
MYPIQVIARAEMNYHLSYKRWSRAIQEKSCDKTIRFESARMNRLMRFIQRESPKAIQFTIGGSRRKYLKDCESMRRNNIQWKQHGRATIGSKKILVSVAESDADKMKALGFPRYRNQWDTNW